MTRIISTGADNLSDRPPLGRGFDTEAGPHGATQNAGAEIIQFLPRARSTSVPSNLPLPAALYSSRENPLPFGKLAQTSLDLVAVIVWLILPLALWGALGLLAFALFFV
jgi:hypothetical protein